MNMQQAAKGNQIQSQKDIFTRARNNIRQDAEASLYPHIGLFAKPKANMRQAFGALFLTFGNRMDLLSPLAQSNGLPEARPPERGYVPSLYARVAAREERPPGWGPHILWMSLDRRSGDLSSKSSGWSFIDTIAEFIRIHYFCIIRVTTYIVFWSTVLPTEYSQWSKIVEKAYCTLLYNANMHLKIIIRRYITVDLQYAIYSKMGDIPLSRNDNWHLTIFSTLNNRNTTTPKQLLMMTGNRLHHIVEDIWDSLFTIIWRN